MVNQNNSNCITCADGILQAPLVHPCELCSGSYGCDLYNSLIKSHPECPLIAIVRIYLGAVETAFNSETDLT